MKTKHALHSRRTLTSGLLACLLTSGLAGAATVLIDPTTNNGSFEYINGVNNPSYTSKISEWDGHANGDVDNWTLWNGVATTFNNSGTEVLVSASTDGVRMGFLQPGNAIYNLATYVVAAGDSYTFSWDHTRGTYAHTVSLVYLNGTEVISIPGTSVASGTTIGNGKGGTFVIPADSPAIGYPVGIGVINDSTNWPNVDNFVLTVTPVPEPSAALLGALGGLLAFSRRRTIC